MGIIQIAMIGIGAVALALMVKQQKSEYALYLSLSAVVLILVFSMNRLQVVMETIRKIEQYTGIDVAMLKILVKLMGITYVAEFSASICQDAGYQTIARQIEILGKLTILVMSMPILLALLQTIREFLT
jgi:stage III sporulation protein AD